MRFCFVYRHDFVQDLNYLIVLLLRYMKRKRRIQEFAFHFARDPVDAGRQMSVRNAACDIFRVVG